MSNLTGSAPKDTYKSLLWIGPGNTGLTTTPKSITDGDGTALPFTVSTTECNFAANALKQSGQPVKTGKDNYGAAVNPAASNDSTQGYSIGSLWINISSTPKDVFICSESSAGAAIWERCRNLRSNNAAVNPAASNDSTQGYSIGSLWINTSTDTTFICKASTPGAAAWIPTGTSLGAAKSVTIAGGNIELVGDLATPGNNKVYGTNGSGVRGYYDLSSNVGQQEIYLHSGNGHGSTNNKIRRYSTAAINVGSSMTYADSATLGASITINATGLYAFGMNDGISGGNAGLGISINSSQLTTDIALITALNRLGYAACQNSNPSVNFSFPSVFVMRYCTSGDVIRPHTDGVCNATAAQVSYFTAHRIF